VFVVKGFFKGRGQENRVIERGCRRRRESLLFKKHGVKVASKGADREGPLQNWAFKLCQALY
jgi:hypothetical protein